MKTLIKLLKEYIALVHKIEGTCFNRYHRHNLGIVHQSVCHYDIGRDASSQINQGMHLYGAFSVMKLCPWG